jgi:hypothetical protein
VRYKENIPEGCSKRPARQEYFLLTPQQGGLDWSLTARIEGAHSDRAHSASERDHPGYPPNFFSILLLREGELGQLRLLDSLLHQRIDIEHLLDFQNIFESGFRAGVWRGEE